MRPQQLEPSATFEQVYAASRNQLPLAEDARVQAFRDERFAEFMRCGLPGPRSEAWKYTSLSTFNRIPFRAPDSRHVDPARLEPHLLNNTTQLVFINGEFSADLSNVGAVESGVRVCPLSQAYERDQLLATLGDNDESRGLSSLNAALASDGVHIRVDPSVTSERVVHVVFVSTRAANGPALVNIRNLIEVGAHGRLGLIETHVFSEAGETATNLINRIRLAEGARLQHDRLQVGDPSGTLIGRTECDLEGDAKLAKSVAILGGQLVRNEVFARLLGRGAEALFNGLYLGRGQQHQDSSLQIEHAAPGCHSDQYYKGVLDDHAHAVFAGKIMVRQVAQKTNAYQTNNNLLLSPEASIDTKPELEIFADDVKCSHGATAGDLDERELFYLRSRGIPPAAARSLLTFAFAGEVIDRFSLDPSRQQVRREVRRWLPGGDALEGLD